MSELAFDVVDIAPEPYAVVPNLTLRLRIAETTGETVHALALRTQLRIEPQRRRYTEAEAAGLHDLFGPRSRWTETLRPFSWLRNDTMVQGFRGQTEVDLTLPCSFDFEVTGAGYLHALRDGDIPLLLLFSGTLFTRGSTGFGVEQISWDNEARYPMPVSVWRALMDQHYPGGGWLRLQRDTIDELVGFKSARGLTSWDATVSTLLAEAGEPAR